MQTKNKTMRIRNADISDLDRITEVEALCFPEPEAATRESLAERLRCYPGHFWVLEEKEQIVGFVNGLVTDCSHLEDRMYENASVHEEDGAWQMIFGVDTIPEYRNRGCATMLLKHVIKAAKQQKRKGIVLTCKEHLVHFYSKFGFKDEGISQSEHGGVIWHEMRLLFSEQDK